MSLRNDAFKLGALAVAISIALTGCRSDSDNDDNVGGDPDPQPQMERLTRIATLPLGSEATGLFMKEDGEVFTNIQHPSDANVTADADAGSASEAEQTLVLLSCLGGCVWSG